MKQIVTACLIAFFIVFAHYHTRAQVNPELQTHAKEKVFQLIDYIEHMVKKTESNLERLNYRRAALSLFIGGGEPYPFEGDTLDGVKMQTITVKTDNTKIKRTRLMKTYFNNLIELDVNLYTEVSIKGTLPNLEALKDPSEMKITPLRTIREDTLYQCTIAFGQYFDAKQGEDYVYRDFTQKKVCVYFSLVPINETSKLIPFLGDVEAEEAIRNNE